MSVRWQAEFHAGRHRLGDSRTEVVCERRQRVQLDESLTVVLRSPVRLVEIVRDVVVHVGHAARIRMPVRDTLHGGETGEGQQIIGGGDQTGGSVTEAWRVTPGPVGFVPKPDLTSSPDICNANHRYLLEREQRVIVRYCHLGRRG